jgi:L,D-peptidoglycan transpeptidase YkuD (ErfK/YbiS/YcfS/YnhG family)
MNQKYIWRLTFLFLTALITLSQHIFGEDNISKPSGIPDSCRQMILVLADNWNNFHAEMFLCEKEIANWAIKASFSAVLGKNGFAWGVGLHSPSLFTDGQLHKKEGDLKSPAGVFTLGKCMGYAPNCPYNPSLDYEPIKETTQGVDDPGSKYYNQIVDTATIQGADWKSFEKMKRADGLYQWLIVVNHNIQNEPGKGSLIFIHIWRNQNSGTTGCTAIAEANMIELLKWLDKSKKPIIVQLPFEVYQKYQKEWDLPEVNFRK